MLAATQKPYTTGPSIRSHYQWSPNSSSYPSTVTITVPSEAVVGDYFIIVTCNPPSIQTNNTGIAMRTLYSPYATGTYNEYATILWGIVTPGSQNTTLTISTTSGYLIIYHTLLLTNPNQSYMASGVVLGNSGADNGSSVGYQTAGAATSGNATSLTDGSPLTRSGTLTYTPGTTRVKAWAYNGSSTWPYYSSYSGSGTMYSLTDGYWWRGAAVCVETNASTTTGTFNISGSSASIAHTEILLI